MGCGNKYWGAEYLSLDLGWENRMQVNSDSMLLVGRAVIPYRLGDVLS